MKRFSATDEKFMKLALQEAEKAFNKGNYPCGAALVVDNELVGTAHNLKEVRQDRVSHAEMLLYIENSVTLKKSKKENKKVTMYTTLEPCLMCFGAAVIHRVDRIVASSPDPYGDMSKIGKANLGSFYTNLPRIDYGLYFDKTYELTVNFLKQKNDREAEELIKLLTDLKGRFVN